MASAVGILKGFMVNVHSESRTALLAREIHDHPWHEATTFNMCHPKPSAFVSGTEPALCNRLASQQGDIIASKSHSRLRRASSSPVTPACTGRWADIINDTDTSAKQPHLGLGVLLLENLLTEGSTVAVCCKPQASNQYVGRRLPYAVAALCSWHELAWQTWCTSPHNRDPPPSALDWQHIWPQKRPPPSLARCASS